MDREGVERTREDGEWVREGVVRVKADGEGSGSVERGREDVERVRDLGEKYVINVIIKISGINVKINRLVHNYKPSISISTQLTTIKILVT